MLLIFLEQALDQWRTGAESDTELSFDLQNAIAIPGMFAKVNPLVKRAYDNQSIILQRKEIYVELFDKRIEGYTDGDIDIEADENIDITSGANLTINVTGNTVIQTTGTTDIKSTGDMLVQSDGILTLRGSQVQINP